VGDAYPSSPGALSPQKFAETDLRRHPTMKFENTDDLHYPVCCISSLLLLVPLLMFSEAAHHRCTVNAQWAKENSRTYETSARSGAATVVVRAKAKGARDPKRVSPGIKQGSKGLSRQGTLRPTLKKSWDEA
jgi:hypothetical protein